MMPLNAAICGVAIVLTCPSEVSPTGTDISSVEIDVTRDTARQHVTNLGRPGLNTLTAVASGPSIVGMASTYNPYRPGKLEGGTETASGEPYDPNAWTAAIQTGLRKKFGGVGFGTNYRPSYALVESADRQVIVKINDVGPLKRGRIIDFNEQTMRYFDSTLQLGLIPSVKVTPLLGDGWPSGPVEGNR
jgi:rare lipoprotein A